MPMVIMMLGYNDDDIGTGSIASCDMLLVLVVVGKKMVKLD